MRTVPSQTKCAYLGCGNDRSPLNTYCFDHGGKGYNDSAKRKVFNAQYHKSAWFRLRKTQLSRKPLCQACALEGKVSAATEVDHLFAWSQLGQEAFYANTFQSLCKNHHTVKTGLEKRGVFRHYTDQVVDYAIDDYNRVVFGATVDNFEGKMV